MAVVQDACGRRPCQSLSFTLAGRNKALLVGVVMILRLLDVRAEEIAIHIFNVSSGAAYDAGHVAQYVFYDADVEYNQAVAICEDIGGTLAKLETVEKKNWIATLPVTPDLDPFVGIIWTAVIEATADQPVWVTDCSSASSLTLPDGWKSTDMCLRLKLTDFTFSRAKCIEGHSFLCEVGGAITLDEANVTVENLTTDELVPVNNCVPPSTTTSLTSTTTTTPTTTTTTTATTTVAFASPATATSAQTTTTIAKTSTTLPPTLSPVCSCAAVGRNITLEEAVAIALELRANLTVPPKTTAVYLRTLKCSSDNRPSSRVLGVLGIIIISTILSVLIFGDILKLRNDLRHFCGLVRCEVCDRFERSTVVSYE